MKSLLPPGTPALPRAVAAATAAMVDLPLPHRATTLSSTCPEELLPALAWERAVPVFRDSWTVAQKRLAIRNAAAVHRCKGTAKALRDAIAPFGQITITEWWQTTPKGAPHTFTLEFTPLDGLPNTADFQTAILDAVDVVKPLHAHGQLRARVDASATVAVAAAIRTVSLVQLTLTQV